MGMQPKLRFKGFTDDWEKRKLGSMGTTYSGLSGKTKEDFGHGNAKFVTYMNVFSNTISKIDGLDSIEIDNKQHQVRNGDVFFTTSSETPNEVGMSSVWTFNIPNIYLNSFTFAYRPTETFDLNYLAFMLRSPLIRRSFIKLAQGISRYNISKVKVMEISVPVPKLIEQKKIGELFHNLDNLITVNQRKVDLLKKKKNGYLQKLFPENGQNNPELRFKGYTDAWEKRKLLELATFSKGQGYSKKDLVSSGYPIILYGRLYTNYQVSITTVNDTFVANNKNAVISEIGDVIVPGSGETAEDISRASSINIAGIILGGDLNVIHPYQDRLDSTFLALNISNGVQQKELTKRAQGKSIVHIHNSDLQTITLKKPELYEQQKISKLFIYLDNLITVNQRKVDLLKKEKKALLQKMFI